MVALAAAPAHDLGDALHQLDPLELRSALVRRVAASGFVTDDILQRLVARLRRYRITSHTNLVDFGCGTGGVSLYLAERTGAHLFGIDADPLAISTARRTARNFRLAHAPHFDCAAFEATWIEPAFAHAVLSVDALHTSPRPLAALAEIHRILAGGGIVVFNVYVADDDPCAVGWVRALEQSGFAMLDIDDQTHVWRQVMSTKHRARIAHGARLAARFGDRAVAPELAISRTMLGLDYGPSVIASTRRVELVARKVTPERFASGSLSFRPVDE